MFRRLIPLLLLSAVAGGAQGVVSVMAGYLHQVDGEVLLEGERISPKAQDLLHLRDGQRLETREGLVEIKISPGSFVRIGPNSTVQMINAGLLAVELRVIKGAAVIDLSDLLEQGAVSIGVGDDGRVEPLSEGVYRVDAAQQGPGRVRVIDGKAAVFAGDNKTTLKQGREIGLAAGASPVKISGGPDAVDDWQELRHEALQARAAESKKVKARDGLDPLEAEILGMSSRRPGR